MKVTFKVSKTCVSLPQIRPGRTRHHTSVNYLPRYVITWCKYAAMISGGGTIYKLGGLILHTGARVICGMVHQRWKVLVL